MRVVDVTPVEVLRAERETLVRQALKAPVERLRKALSIPKEPTAADPSPAPSKKWHTKLAHPTYQIVGEECPACGFPEAEGGYCEECGWSKPHPFKGK